MRSKKKIIITTFIGAIMLLAGCHSVGTDQEQKDNKKTDSETVKIEDIDWNVGEGIIDGDRHIVMNYVNNSKLDIVYFGLDYTEKEEITEEEKQKYMVKYAMQRYTKESCEKIVMIIDTIYHWYDVSSEEAEKVFMYAEEKHVTSSEAIEKTIGGMGLEELAEFTTEVYPKIKQIYDNTLLRTIANASKETMNIYSIVNVLANTFEKKDSNNENKES